MANGIGITPNTISAVVDLLQTGDIGFGSNVEVFEDRFKSYSDKAYNIGLSSASAAIHCLFAFLFKMYGSCDVFTPSLGFVSPVQAAIKNGHKVYFLDVDENLLVNYDLYYDIRCWHLERQINIDFNKSVFMPILYGGISNINDLVDRVRKSNWGDIVVVDSSHSISPTIESDFIFFSFHPTKPLIMANGGILSTNDLVADEYIRSYRNFGRQSSGDSYDIIMDGFNFYLNNLNATIGLSQLDTYLENIKLRKNNFNYLKNKITLDVGYFTQHDKHSSYQLATLILRNKGSKALRVELQANGFKAMFCYPFLHKSKFYSQKISLPNTESMEDRIINLPIHHTLTADELSTIGRIVNEQNFYNC